jgi:CTP:molybdopterin cytidylyltransferase MocA
VTVAAVILAASAESALADADGLAAVRRIADAAWSGGATPIVVVSSDPDGAVAVALAGASVTLAGPAPFQGGPVAQIRRGIEVAMAEIQDTDAAIVWPAGLTWVGPETVTSLIEAHGTDPDTLLRPTYQAEAGWPVLLPTRYLEALGPILPDRGPDDVLVDLDAAGVPLRELDLGDPGTTHDRGVPIGELPPYDGPPEPAARHTHEWGAALADEPEESPLEGPALAPFGQAADPDQSS